MKNVFSYIYIKFNSKEVRYRLATNDLSICFWLKCSYANREIIVLDFT